ncbi:radical SAM-associated putative lipoprotein [uncultured Alistipes sp.]|uniref:radical SAM-associated putative lipoprotein n=1 Tax=uncultured Alistipes sp. TaxID=538949 RepID=UPI0025952DC6|nr:radical SAM-associated putative lipoprotein [uncultured Alistipes sp.]
MKKRIKKRLSLLLLTLLGFSTACEKLKNGETPPDMYGTPHVDIRVGGKVTDKTGTPIPGIEVRQQNTPYKALTGNDGSYELPGQLFSIETTADILFTDTDGPANGGEFEAQTLEITFTEADRVSEAEGWCGGSFARTGVDVTLKEEARE